jgi:hypothetical protein
MCTQGLNSYTCTCRSGFSGSQCQNVVGPSSLAKQYKTATYGLAGAAGGLALTGGILGLILRQRAKASPPPPPPPPPKTKKAVKK